MKRKVFFVLGGESTGTRLTTRLLVDAGCFGDVDHEQRMDTWVLKNSGELQKQLKKGQPLVWRRSFPHDKKMPDIAKDLVDPSFRSYGVNYAHDVMFLVTMRNWVCAAKSAMKAGHSKSYDGAIKKLKSAYMIIFSFLANHPLYNYRIVNYEWLTSWRFYALTSLYRDCGLDVNRERAGQIASTLRNENDKWFMEYINEQTQTKT